MLQVLPGAEVEALGPDHSTISKFRSRLGAERFGSVFNSPWLMEAARAVWMIIDRLHAIDAQDVEAKIDLWNNQRTSRRGRDKGDDNSSGFVNTGTRAARLS